jgi:hypothetical protein
MVKGNSYYIIHTYFVFFRCVDVSLKVQYQNSRRQFQFCVSDHSDHVIASWHYWLLSDAPEGPAALLEKVWVRKLISHLNYRLLVDFEITKLKWEHHVQDMNEIINQNARVDCIIIVNNTLTWHSFIELHCALHCVMRIMAVSSYYIIINLSV